MPVFFTDRDYRKYLRLLAEQCSLHELRVWAYCLMPNHVHLIVVPSTREALARSIARSHQSYAWRVNRSKGWVGHLWQERFSSFPMDETHLFFAVRYVLRNPVRAGLVSRPEAWPFSSAGAHLEGRGDRLVDTRPMAERITDWVEYWGNEESDRSLDLLRKHSRSGRPLGKPLQH